MPSTYYLTDLATWTDAQAMALAMGGNLVTINDAAENELLVKAFGGQLAFWIGLNDAEKEGVWKWVSGEQVTYTNWYPGEPNNALNIEDYAHINLPPVSNSSGKWNDLPNNPDDLGVPEWSIDVRGIIEVKNAIPAISINDVNVIENNPLLEFPVATFTVKLSGVTDQPVVVIYYTKDGTAKAGADYTAVANSLVFNPGETVKTFTVPITEDGKAESSLETFDVVLSNPINATIGDGVGKGTIVDGTYEYFLSTEPSTWTDAQAMALAMGGNLVTINSAEENQFLVDTFGTTEAFWIGLNDVENEGVWKWVSGEEVTYTNWHPGEPNNALNIEDYAHINLPWVSNSSGKWNDFPNNPDDLGNPLLWSIIRGIVERVLIQGTNNNNTITGTDNREAIEGLGGNDNIIAKAGNDYLSGGDGNDNLDGGEGADVMQGGAGNDIYTVDDSKDQVIEAANQGTDAIKSSIAQTLPNNAENLTLTGTTNINGTGNTLDNTLTGNSGKNKLSGNTGNDKLDGKAGADTLIGGLGNDNYIVDSADIVTELAAQGTDLITTNTNYVLPINFENLILTGTAANGMGNELSNIVTGNASNNLLIGNGGSDTLDGKAGADILIGGVGNDFFVFNLPTERIDTILDFASGDKIRVDDTGFGGGLVPGVLPASRFVVGTKALDADDRFIYNADRFIYNVGALFYDVDGSGSTAQIQIATLIGAPTLAASDFVIF
ncbi:MAG: hypothetical protein DSM107014_12500 [Gomphosphaeria aponina SAG 52.96 = DSM 107014]|uniref:C-type lectin domain-containing protein n=1 Tax=Gomphosphaeria aponina SAG 52.96 = DSM 107014 TaxID=1521640 RepID=A0A941GQX7_9CHRO|nr:hypothetical protein [Gomphosphaeria aponina SAG 52.96 = DSM 107014]